MDTQKIENHLNSFLDKFDCLTRDELLARPTWQLTEIIKKNKAINADGSLMLTQDEKINSLVTNYSHPYRQLVTRLEIAIKEKHDETTITNLIDHMCNGRFLDSIGVPGQTKYSDLIEDLCDKLRILNNTSY